MTLHEAYKLLGIHDENISSDDLIQIYNSKLAQYKKNPFLQNRKSQLILAHQMVRNYRESVKWKGSTKGHGVYGNSKDSVNKISVFTIPKKRKINLSFFVSLVSVVFRICLIVFLLILISYFLMSFV